MLCVLGNQYVFIVGCLGVTNNLRWCEDCGNPLSCCDCFKELRDEDEDGS